MDHVCAQHFGSFRVQNSPCSTSSDFYKSSVKPSYLVDIVWVWVSGLPASALDDFLALLGLGPPFDI
jgi:hypothetical protein